MDKRIIELKATIAELIINLNMRIDDIISSYKSEGVLDNERIANLFDDMQSLAGGIGVIKEHVDGIDLLEFRDKLEMTADALEKADSALLIDILQFEVKDLLDYWKDCLTK